MLGIMTRGAPLLWAVGLALALSGCTTYLVGPRRHAPAVHPALPPPSVPAELAVDGFLVERDGHAERVSLDEPLHTGDRISFVLSASEYLDVYIVNLGSDGSARVIWPREPTCIGTQAARVPQGSWFELLPPAGHEILAIVGTRTEGGSRRCACDGALPLDAAAEKELAALVRAEAARGDLVRVEGERPPGTLEGHATVGFRGAGLRLDGTRVSVPTLDDLAVLLVDVDHRPPP